MLRRVYLFPLVRHCIKSATRVVDFLPIVPFVKGSYDGCDTTVVSEENVVFSMDPSEVIENSSYPCWDVRDSPQVIHNVLRQKFAQTPFQKKNDI